MTPRLFSFLLNQANNNQCLLKARQKEKKSKTAISGAARADAGREILPSIKPSGCQPGGVRVSVHRSDLPDPGPLSPSPPPRWEGAQIGNLGVEGIGPYLQNRYEILMRHDSLSPRETRGGPYLYNCSLKEVAGRPEGRPARRETPWNVHASLAGPGPGLTPTESGTRPLFF